MQQTNPYNDVKLSQFKMWLHDMVDKGEGKFIEVYVNDVKVVPRTSKIESLDDHKVYLEDTTETVKVFVYNTENSNRYTQFLFFIEKKKPVEVVEQVQTPQVIGLSGIELENKITERLTVALMQERERWQNELMKREFETCKKDLTDAEEYIEDLEQKLSHYKSKKLHWGDVNLGDVASVIVEGMVKRNPHWVAKLPGGDALAGLIAQEATENGTAEVIDNEVVFTKKTPAEEGMTEETKAQLGFLKQLETHFNQEQLDKIMLILQSFVEVPKNIETVFELLEIKK
ncbi:MAG: hypothetical protein H0W75_00070 [Chitinophagaceae bacterium]|nr:hypothetical protein [Chitinophagaceae bacterium]